MRLLKKLTKGYFQLFIFLCFNVCLIAQVNLVPNGNFELGSNGAVPGCYTYYSPGGNCGGWPNGIACSNRFNDDVANWNVAHRKITSSPFYTYGSPDWIDSTSCPAECFSSGNALHNNTSRYVHMSSEIENIRVGLQKNGTTYKLIPNKKYIFRIRVQPISTGKIRVFFTEWGKHWNSGSNRNEKWEANNANIHFNRSPNCEWQFITREFTAPSGLNNLDNLILVMGDDQAGANYTRLCVDDVQLFENNTCPENRFIQNFIHWNETRIYQAKNDLVAGNNVIVPLSPFSPLGDVIVKQNSRIIYRAGNQVDIRAGFQTESGAYFDAQIHPCEENPCPNAKEKQKELYICGNTPTPIGFPEDMQSTIFHDWHPTANLDNAQSSNPNFTPPPGVGKIVFRDRLSSVCGYFLANRFPPITQYVENKVTVFYDSNPSATPSLTINSLSFNDYNFSYSINVDSHTEWFKVEILDAITNSVLNTKYFKRDIDFACCTINSTYNNSLLTRCKDYIVRFSTKNYCFETIASETRSWDIENSINVTLLPNTFSPDNDGINDNWCIEVEGADTYELEIYNRWGICKNSSGRISNYRICLWDGKNNNGRLVNDGTYYFILKIRNDCGDEIIKTGNITKF